MADSPRRVITQRSTGSRLGPAVPTALVALAFVAGLLQPVAPASGQAPAEGPVSQGAAGHPDLPSGFEANHGQVDSPADYMVRGDAYTAFLSPAETTFALRPGSTGATDTVGMRLRGADPAATADPGPQLPGHTNYLLGPDPEDWHTEVPSYRTVRYRDVYPGIDVVYHRTAPGLKYDFVVAPGRDPSVIALAFSGEDDLAIDPGGELVVSTAGGELRQERPFVYQDIDGRRQEVAGDYRIDDSGAVGFALGEYDTSRSLVIDPAVDYSTYLGGSLDDRGFAIAVGSDGSAYVVGTTASPNFPAVDPAVTPLPGSTAAFLAKLAPDGGALEYTTYIGGRTQDEGLGVAVDASGSAYVTGTTNSEDFPTVGAVQDARSGLTPADLDAFVVKLAPDGSALEFSTYLGGSGNDRARGIAIDGDGRATIAGETASADFPVVDAVQAGHGGDADAFVTQLAPDGSTLRFSTYLGGSAADRGRSVAIDEDGRVTVVGETASADFPVVNAVQTGHGGGVDAFVARLGADGSAVQFSTFLGGSANDQASGVALGPGGGAYVSGRTGSDDFPTVNALFAERTGVVADVFLTRLGPDGGTLTYSTYLGDSGLDTFPGGQARSPAVAVHTDGSAYVAGGTYAGTRPTINPIAQFEGTVDAFLTKVVPDGSALEYSTYFGGSTNTNGHAIALDDAGSAYVTGFTTAPPLFPTRNAAQEDHAGGADGFVTRIVDHDPGAPLITALEPQRSGVEPRSGPVSGGTAVTITGRNLSDVSTVRFGNVEVGAFTVESDERITAVSPAHPAGTVVVTATGPGGASPPNPIAEFTYARGRWEATGALPEPRFIHSTTLLEDGRVLVAGGRRDHREGEAMTSAHLYDPHTGQWSATGDLNHRRWAHTATLLTAPGCEPHCGKVLVTGGFDNPGHPPPDPPLTSAELFDPVTGTWTETGSLNHSRALHATVQLEDGRVLAVSGRGETNNDIRFVSELYDPATGIWTETGSVNEARWMTSVIRLDDGRVLSAGGFADEAPFPPRSTAEVYDPDTGTWTPVDSMATPRSRLVFTLLDDGRVLVSSGWMGSGPARTPEIFDPDQGTWELTDDHRVARHNAFGSPRPLPDGSVLVAGGFIAKATSELWDPDSGQWEDAGPLPTAHGADFTFSHIGNAIILSGDPEEFLVDPRVCGERCGKVLIVGNTDSPRTASLYTPDDLAVFESCTAGLGVAPSGFGDIGGNFHERAIECLAAYDVTRGTTATTFTPAQAVRRDQMASFVARMLERAGVKLPAPGEQGFTDITGNVHADAINQLAEMDVVLGTTPTTFSPSQPVRRDQMVSLLVRAYESVAQDAMPEGDPPFTDVAGNVHGVNIAKAHAARVTLGTTETTFSPAQSVRRDQMASFIVRMMGRLATDGTLPARTGAGGGGG